MKKIKPQALPLHCKICGAKDDTRFGWCFYCMEAQTIIGMGLDAWDKGNGGKKLPALQATERLHLLIAKGWRHSERNAKAKGGA